MAQRDANVEVLDSTDKSFELLNDIQNQLDGLRKQGRCGEAHWGDVGSANEVLYKLAAIEAFLAGSDELLFNLGKYK